MLPSTKVLEIWIMETKNIYDFLHLLSIIKIWPYMDFGGKLAFVRMWHKTHSFSSFFYQGEWKKARFDRPNKHVKDTPFICLFYLIRL